MVLGPFNKLWHLLPSRNHRFRIKQDYYVPLASILLILKGCWQAGSSCLCYPRFKSIVVWLSKHEIGVLPLIMSFYKMTSLILENILFKVHVVIHGWLIIIFFLTFVLLTRFGLFLFIFLRFRLWRNYPLLCLTLIVRSWDYLPEVIIFDAEGRQFGHVVGSWQILNILKSMRAIEVSQLHVKSLSAVIHFLQEILCVIRVVVELKWLNLLRCFLVVSLLVQPLAKILSQSKGGIIPRRQHESIKQLIDWKNIARL